MRLRNHTPIKVCEEHYLPEHHHSLNGMNVQHNGLQASSCVLRDVCSPLVIHGFVRDQSYYEAPFRDHEYTIILSFQKCLVWVKDWISSERKLQSRCKVVVPIV